jgi:hypothetical protein
MNATYFISASLPVDATDDRLFARRLHALGDLSVGVLHVAALRSGFGAYNQTTNGNRPEGHNLARLHTGAPGGWPALAARAPGADPCGAEPVTSIVNTIRDLFTQQPVSTDIWIALAWEELTYLRISRDRARVVLFGYKRLLADHELDDRDLMVIVASLRDMTTQLPADQYTPNSLTW